MLSGTGLLANLVLVLCSLYVISIILNQKFGLASEESWKSQRNEFCLISFLSMTNLADSKVAEILRLVSFYFITFAYLLISTVFMIICNINPSGIFVPALGADGGGITWR